MASNNDNKILNTKDIIAYLIVAGTGALVQLLSSSLLQDWFGISFQSSIKYSYLISLVVGFVLTKLFAFNARNTNQTRREMIKFLMVALFSGGVTWVGSVGSLYLSQEILNIPDFRYQMPFGKKVINVNEMGCYIFGMGCSFVSNYILHKIFTFKSTGFYDRLKAILIDA